MNKKFQVGGNHYAKHIIQPFDITRSWKLDFFEGNVIKYALRNKKDKIEDLKKASHYLMEIINNNKTVNERVFNDSVITPDSIIKEYKLEDTHLTDVICTFHYGVMSNNINIRNEHFNMCLADIDNEIKRLS